MKIKVDFYADNFRGGIIDVPNELKNFNEKQRREYITDIICDILISKGIYPPDTYNGHRRHRQRWKPNHCGSINDKNSINIITAKIVSPHKT